MFYSHEGANRAVCTSIALRLFQSNLGIQYSPYIAQVRGGYSVVSLLDGRSQASKDASLTVAHTGWWQLSVPSLP